MRLWSIHPKYLDAVGLVAVWREGLLAKAVLSGKTKGYRNHPQLERFKNTKSPITSINAYLKFILKESLRRKYSFDQKKLGKSVPTDKIKVNKGQLEYEFMLLKRKIQKRSTAALLILDKVKRIESHPLFSVIPGQIEKWEKIT